MVNSLSSSIVFRRSHEWRLFPHLPQPFRSFFSIRHPSISLQIGFKVFFTAGRGRDTWPHPRPVHNSPLIAHRSLFIAHFPLLIPQYVVRLMLGENSLSPAALTALTE